MIAAAISSNTELEQWNTALDRQPAASVNKPHNSQPGFHVVSDAPASPRCESAPERAAHQLAKSTQDLRERLHNALKRRIGPHTGIRLKVVAQATGLTERTIENAMSGGTMPRGDTLMALLSFFPADFANEVFAGENFMLVKLSDQRAADAARMINTGAAILQALARSA